MKQTMQPRASIITPYFQTGDKFFATIKSVEQLNFDNFEWIIIDDHSKKDTAKDVLAKVYGELPNYIRVISLDKNIGPNGARIIGIKAAKGKYISLLDSDDIYYREKLNVQIGFMETYGHKITHTDTVKFKRDNFSNTFLSGDVINWTSYMFTRKFPVNTVAFERKFFILKFNKGEKATASFERQFPGEDILIFEMLFWENNESYRINQILSAYCDDNSRSSNYVKNFIGILYFQTRILLFRRKYNLLPMIFFTVVAAALSRLRNSVKE